MTLDVPLELVVIALVDVLEAMVLEFVFEVVALKNMLDIVALEEVLTDLTKPGLLLAPVNFAKVEVVALERAEELALKTEKLDETLPDPPDRVLDELISEDTAITIPIRLYRARVSSNMTNDLYMSKVKPNNSQCGFDDCYSSSK